MVASDCVRYPLCREETAGCRAGGVDPKEDEDGNGAVLANQLHEVFSPIVGIAARDDAIKVLNAEQNDDQGGHGEDPG